MEMVLKLHQFQFEINIKNLPLWINVWEYFLLLSLQPTKYTWYGTFSIQQLKNLDSTHPGAFEEICGTSKTGIDQAIDLAEEQTWEMQKQQVFLLSFPIVTRKK